jgi:hypothetical protein
VPVAHLLALLAAADALGVWTANGAKLELKDEGGKVVGRLAAAGGPCPVAAGTELLKGTLLDDSLSAQVRLCVVSEKCGAAPDTALAVLLVTRTLTGGVHTKAACAQDVHALVLRRPGPPMAMTPPPPTERLSKTEPPKSPRAVQNIGLDSKIDVGQIAGRPVGEPQHPRYDPRDARKIDQLLSEGAALLQQGKFESARRTFQEAIQTDPQRAESYNGVGVTFYARGDLDEALAWYKRSLEVDPRFGDAFYNMACVYALQARKDLAFRYLRMAALNHYSEREVMERDPDLASLRGDRQWRQILDQMRP